MSELEQECGDTDESEQLRDHARVVVNDVAEHAGEVRDVFLSQPEMAQLLEK
ncbi:MAG TPA: hypothetical protein VFR47_05605 [Anaerolineales bacterium]|nr:hypothetical protein [Anaerolineales bacterium]